MRVVTQLGYKEYAFSLDFCSYSRNTSYVYTKDCSTASALLHKVNNEMALTASQPSVLTYIKQNHRGNRHYIAC